MARRRKPSQTDKLPEHLLPFASQVGEVICMRCRRPFESPDRLRIRTCTLCSETNSQQSVDREVASDFPVWGRK